jgi:hypothetical protein
MNHDPHPLPWTELNYKSYALNDQPCLAWSGLCIHSSYNLYYEQFLKSERLYGFETDTWFTSWNDVPSEDPGWELCDKVHEFARQHRAFSFCIMVDMDIWMKSGSVCGPGKLFRAEFYFSMIETVNKRYNTSDGITLLSTDRVFGYFYK